MADYYPLIAKAVSGLDKSTGETRRALYDRARTALLAQLRGVEPALSEQDITRERLALEEAIRKVEAEVAFQRSPEAARRQRGEPLSARPEPAPRSELPADPPQEFAASGYGTRAPRSSIAADDGDDHQAETEETRQAVPLSAAATAARAPDNTARRTERWSAGGSLPDNALRGFRESIGEYGSPDDGAVRAYPTADHDFERFEQGSGQWAEHDDDLDQGLEHPIPRLSSRDAPRAPTPLMDQDDAQSRATQSFPRIVRPERGPSSERMASDHRASERLASDRRASERPLEATWSAPRNTNRTVAIAVIGLLVAAIAGTAFWFADDIMSSMRGGAGRTADQAAPADGNSRKIAERAPSALGSSEGALATQKVVLYEEDPANPNGTQFGGAAIWRTERVAPGPGQKPDVVIRGEIEIPEQKISVRLSLRRNDDKQLPASHTVEIMFTLPPDFSHGGIANIPGIMMKQGETTRGVALNGVAVKVTNNFFLVGLSSVDADMQRNVQLLKERSWFDIPVVYGDGKRALIAIEKGIPGERAFSEAFAAWEQ
jgi:hypothetical protein